MFIHRRGDPEANFLIPQTSHAWLAWQVACHWGNRRFVRPAPQAETLAAILLHDSGWVEFEDNPGIDGDGRPRAFDQMPVERHLEIWRSSVHRAAQYSRYAGLLVAWHFSELADAKRRRALEAGETDAAALAEEFASDMSARSEDWRTMLGRDPRYQRFLTGSGWTANTSLIAACDLIALWLCASWPSPFTASAAGPSGAEQTIRFDEISPSTWRVRPWPLQGDQLRVHCEGRRVAASPFAGAEEFREAFDAAPRERLDFTLLRSSAVG
jgi:hypothetical protein